MVSRPVPVRTVHRFFHSVVDGMYYERYGHQTDHRRDPRLLEKCRCTSPLRELNSCANSVYGEAGNYHGRKCLPYESVRRGQQYVLGPLRSGIHLERSIVKCLLQLSFFRLACALPGRLWCPCVSYQREHIHSTMHSWTIRWILVPGF